MQDEPAGAQLEVALELPPDEQLAQAGMERFGGDLRRGREGGQVLVPHRIADRHLRRREALDEGDAREKCSPPRTDARGPRLGCEAKAITVRSRGAMLSSAYQGSTRTTCPGWGVAIQVQALRNPEGGAMVSCGSQRQNQSSAGCAS